jgi:hypothetical protein
MGVVEGDGHETIGDLVPLLRERALLDVPGRPARGRGRDLQLDPLLGREGQGEGEKQDWRQGGSSVRHFFLTLFVAFSTQV